MTDMKETNQSVDNQTLVANWQQVKEQMTQAYEQASERDSRSANTTILLAVSKTKPANMIATLANEGQQHFGENYLQEAI